MFRMRFIIIFTFLLLIVAIIVIYLSGIRMYKMHSNSSMFPTLKKGDYFLVQLNPDISGLHRGDIILIRNHTNFIELPILTKRIIGLPNETINISDDSVFIMNEFLPESYTYFELGHSPYSRLEKQKITNEHYFVMGDNRDISIDSRDFRVGTIDGINIVGKVIKIF